MAKISEDAWRNLLRDTLQDLKGLGRTSLDRLLDEYAPRLAGLSAAESSAAAAEEFEDIKVNLRAAGRVAGIRGETIAVKTIKRVLLLAAGLARTVAVG